MNISGVHKFHIPVLGTGFSIDTPIKVAKFGISSVISLVDDTIMEKLREHYSKKNNIEYVPINENEDDARARRITQYLNLVNKIVKEKFSSLKNSGFELGSDLHKYFEMLPDKSELKIKFDEMLSINDSNLKLKTQKWLLENIEHGSIDVNIMTKLDKVNYDEKGNPLSNEFNDAHASLRGYAHSDLESSVIFSAGMNPRLYSYLEKFKDFYPKIDGSIKKKIVLKVSDFRSALIQGRFLAKKGLWISEYRIESGLNCGGHAFATDGYLMGPILEEFKSRKDELFNTVKSILKNTLNNKGISFNESKLNIDITAQGGIGKSSEHEFLMRRYGIKSVGWGSPFLLVPEVMNVDDETLAKLSEAKENDIYLSKVSPLGIPFNNLRSSSKEIEKMERIEQGKPGSMCPKKFLVSDKEFSDKPLCTASITYLNKKIKGLKEKYIYTDEFKKEFDKAVDKVCLCVGLASSVMKVNKIDTPKLSKAVSVCPGPNMAYFSKVVNLKEMVDHIYGKINLIVHPDRPNMFVKELSLYIDYYIQKVDESIQPLSKKTEDFLASFHSNLIDGINYYKSLIPEIIEETEKVRIKIMEDLEDMEKKLLSYSLQVA